MWVDNPVFNYKTQGQRGRLSGNEWKDAGEVRFEQRSLGCARFLEKRRSWSFGAGQT
jgi:hypothetical protein